MEKVIFPTALQSGDKIAICAFSSGVESPFHKRLDIVLNGLTLRGYEVIEGECLRQKNCSAKQRADELMTFLTDDSIAAIMPPWGGELAMEILPHLDFNVIKKSRPKWLVGFSDISTLACVITAKCGWATLHCTNLMQLHPDEQDTHCLQVFKTLELEAGNEFTQTPAAFYQGDAINYAQSPDALFSLLKPSQWRCLNVKDNRDVELSGRLFGGCLDTLGLLLTSPFLSLHEFKKQFAPHGLVLYLENAELQPAAVLRFIISLKLNDIFGLINGLIIGRSAVISTKEQDIDYYQALELALSDRLFPVIIDADIGHVAPNLCLVNGAKVKISARLENTLVKNAKIITYLE
ncbi:S66 peptidase family protein [Pseudoalteromonas neustonica]|uniref:S66 peptidase family protein n=1 Tax=Pseudoalteromonas neustonica TaxID=1840331 RepID=A0ABU9U390_9GAMM